MAYVKLPWLAYVDHVVGFQSINTAQANIVEHSDVLSLRHGSIEPGLAFGITRAVEVPRQFGNHNDTRIPRSMYYVDTSSLLTTSVFGSTFGRPTLTASTQNVVTRFERLAQGVYFAAVTGLAEFFANPVATVSAAADVRRVQTTTFLPTQAADSGVLFVAEELDGSNVFQPTDFDFSFALYGTV